VDVQWGAQAFIGQVQDACTPSPDWDTEMPQPTAQSAGQQNRFPSTMEPPRESQALSASQPSLCTAVEVGALLTKRVWSAEQTQVAVITSFTWDELMEQLFGQSAGQQTSTPFMLEAARPWHSAPMLQPLLATLAGGWTGLNGAKCMGFIGCIGFIGCMGSIGFIGCIGCIGSIGFIGCMGCIGGTTVTVATGAAIVAPH